MAKSPKLKPRYNALGQLLCDATAKQTGELCRKIACRGKTKCVNHGGKSTGGPIKHGRYSKFLKEGRLKSILADATEGVEELHDQTERLKLLDGLLIQHLEKLSAGGSAELWKDANKAFGALEDAIKEQDPATIVIALALLKDALQNGVGESKAEDKVRSLIDQQARVSMVQIRLEYSKATSVSGREIAALMARLEYGIRQFVHDPSERKALLAFLVGEVA